MKREEAQCLIDFIIGGHSDDSEYIEYIEFDELYNDYTHHHASIEIEEGCFRKVRCDGA